MLTVRPYSPGDVAGSAFAVIILLAACAGLIIVPLIFVALARAALRVNDAIRLLEQIEKNTRPRP